MKIELLTGSNSIEPIIKKPEVAGGTAPDKVNGGGSFAEHFKSAMNEVNELQKNADNQIEALALGKDNVSPHSAMIALEKADMAFQMMNSIRSKIIRAYEEVIRTQV